MLPSLTVQARRFDRRRAALAIASGVLALAAVASQSASTAAPPALSLAEELRPATWGIFVPATWLAAPAPRAQRGDLLDLLAVKPGERAYATPITYGAAVLVSDERGFVLEVDESDATAIATARASGMQLIALLRSSR